MKFKHRERFEKDCPTCKAVNQRIAALHLFLSQTNLSCRVAMAGAVKVKKEIQRLINVRDCRV